VRTLVSVYKKSRHKHELIDKDDYITDPKKSGYRSYHLIYSYKSNSHPIYNGHKIEIQLRSRLQHIWATAVETVGVFTGYALKSSSGQEAWLRFFALMGTAVAIKEKTVPVPNTPDDPVKLKEELRHYNDELNVIHRLRTYSAAYHIMPGVNSRYAAYRLIVLDRVIKEVQIYNFDSNHLKEAFTGYSYIEKQITNREGLDVVLVSVDSFKQLRRAYPNYFLDTRAFVDMVESAIR
jgi:hypothetical protein